ncbi:NAD-dependent succinate-semialdehyde dehydrogenase [Bradyrhizobium zhanjiangense]|uniref:NAD-dependent succinate-semialdehyde dehydrogenase n=1 Tax=Bradyrhizobium zhanjiangense TaxID=1325107 RepID=UPI001FDF80E1|nr:NAD-dependent succinate-semialdehyde dehydrogenase [Bradyrhizobium zhanjiangense]
MRNFIAGDWTDGCENRQLAVTDPSDGSLIANVPDSGAADAKAALDAAQTAFNSWRTMSARDRAGILKNWHDAIVAHREDLGRLISREQGKPLAEGRGEVLYAASYVEWFAEQATRANGEVIPSPFGNKRLLAVREPVGVVAVVTPWNFPAAMIARKIAPALAAGCTVVAKPAEDTPLTALALVKLAQEAGVPAGVINIVTASRERTPTVVDVWLGDERVRKISFTGSTPVGKHLARDSASTLKRLSLELGGNAPFIVFDDANIEAAVEGLMAAKFRNGGQTCVCPNRVYVHDVVHDTFVAKLAERVSALKVGPASDPTSQIGPMINERAVQKIERHVRDAVSQGARIVVGGERIRKPGAPQSAYFAPTVLVGTTHSMACSCEETFGPVVPVTRFHVESEVVAQANATPFGLAAYFYTESPARIWRVAEALECGIVGINEGVFSAEAAPFGGVKESGYGREGSVHGLDDYQHIKYLCQGGIQ